MTTKSPDAAAVQCPAQALLKQLSGKWKPEIFRMALSGPLRFSSLLRALAGASRQSLTVALKELEASGLLERIVVRAKPLHVIYTLTEKGQSLVGIFETLEGLGPGSGDTERK